MPVPGSASTGSSLGRACSCHSSGGSDIFGALLLLALFLLHQHEYEYVGNGSTQATVHLMEGFIVEELTHLSSILDVPGARCNQLSPMFGLFGSLFPSLSGLLFLDAHSLLALIFSFVAPVV